MAWQKLNVTAFTISGIATLPAVTGDPYVDGSGRTYLPMIKQPIAVFLATVVSQLDRMALRADNQVHHVQTWVTQRETWVRYGSRWLMWRVDQLRDQRRLIDGRPG